MTYKRTFEVTVTWSDQPTANEYGLLQEALGALPLMDQETRRDFGYPVTVSVSDPGYALTLPERQARS